MTAKKEDLDELVPRLQNAAGENLESVVLYGSAAGNDFSEEHSDLNVLCIVRDLSAPALDRLTPVIDWWVGTRRHRPPLFLTPQELTTSADVFAIETLDIKENHRVLAGRDVLADIAVPMHLHRVQLEHELRTLLLRLRQHYLLASDEQQLEAAVAKSTSSLVLLLRHALIALGHTPRSRARREVLAQAAEIFGLDFAAVHAALDVREGRRLEFGVRELYDRYLRLLSALTRAVDEAAPKKEWQRVPGSDATPQERKN